MGSFIEITSSSVTEDLESFVDLIVGLMDRRLSQKPVGTPSETLAQKVDASVPSDLTGAPTPLRPERWNMLRTGIYEEIVDRMSFEDSQPKEHQGGVKKELRTAFMAFLLRKAHTLKCSSDKGKPV